MIWQRRFNLSLRRASFCLASMCAGNSNNLFSIDRQSGLVTRGLKALDRETSSSHVLEVEAYNSDEGSMRSSVRVRKGTEGVQPARRDSSLTDLTLFFPLQVIIYVDDANDEVPVFTQQQYNRLGLRETAGIGTSVIVVRATDPDTGEENTGKTEVDIYYLTSQFRPVLLVLAR